VSVKLVQICLGTVITCVIVLSKMPKKTRGKKRGTHFSGHRKLLKLKKKNDSTEVRSVITLSCDY